MSYASTVEGHAIDKRRSASMAGSEGTEAGTSTSQATGASPREAITSTGAERTTSGTRDPKGGSSSESEPTPGPVAIASRLEAVRVTCLMNAEYHGSREAFLDSTHRWFMFGVIAFGASALIDALPETLQWLRHAFPAVAALLGALDLTFDLSNRARSHAMMKRRYFELLGDLNEERRSVDEVRTCLERYSADEEPPYRVLLLSCWNAAQRTVFGTKAQQFRIPKRAMFLRNVLRQSSSDFGRPSEFKPH